ERLAEDAHGGKFGSIARSVNIHIDKLGRDAKSAKKDLDQLLGPAPEGSLGTIDLLATALPGVRPGGPAPAVPPPPSEFRFQDPSPPPAPPRKSATRPATPPSFPVASPPPAPPPPAFQSPPPFQPPPHSPTASQYQRPMGSSMGIDDDILGGGSPEPSRTRIDPYFK